MIAIATGISDGCLGLGLNARPVLIRGLAEMTRPGVAPGGRPETFMGLAGVGDLILTCTGDLSRNRRVGLALAKGSPLASVLDGLGHIAEGVYTARAVMRLAGYLGVEMPITRAVCRVLDDPGSAKAAVQELMAQEQKPESRKLFPSARPRRRRSEDLGVFAHLRSTRANRLRRQAMAIMEAPSCARLSPRMLIDPPQKQR